MKINSKDFQVREGDEVPDFVANKPPQMVPRTGSTSLSSPEAFIFDGDAASSVSLIEGG